eukprot:TRINITY_DN60452_c0_g1_i1.p1 TRINITY_DN60452_c0_g1~~TRINITY_DN60452_c0_g1_i1.p1  ORF type:complete len:1451 (+),score=247.46 TRINITY_DN60452_c0_g1_i1:253-4353(+)
MTAKNRNPLLRIPQTAVAQSKISMAKIDVYGNGQNCEFGLLVHITNDPNHLVDLTAAEGKPLMYYGHGTVYFKFGASSAQMAKSGFTWWAGRRAQYSNISTSLSGLSKPLWRQTAIDPIMVNYTASVTPWSFFYAVIEPTVSQRTLVAYWDRPSTPMQLPHQRFIYLLQPVTKSKTFSFDVVHRDAATMSLSAWNAEHPYATVDYYLASNVFCLQHTVPGTTCPSQKFHEFNFTLAARRYKYFHFRPGASPKWMVSAVPRQPEPKNISIIRSEMYVWQSSAIVRLHSGTPFRNNITSMFNGTEYSAQYYMISLPTGHVAMTIELTPLNGGTFNFTMSNRVRRPYTTSKYITMYNTTDSKLVVSLLPNQTQAGTYYFAVMSHEVGASYSLMVKTANGVVDMNWDSNDRGYLTYKAMRYYELEMDYPRDVSLTVQAYGGGMYVYVGPQTLPFNQLYRRAPYRRYISGKGKNGHILSLYIRSSSWKRRYHNFKAVRIALKGGRMVTKRTKRLSYTLYPHLITKRPAWLRLGQPVYATLGGNDFDHYQTRYNYPKHHNKHHSWDDVAFSVRSLDVNASKVGQPILYISETRSLSTPAGPSCYQYFRQKRQCFATRGTRVFQNVKNRQYFFLTVDIQVNKKALAKAGMTNTTVATSYELEAGAGRWYYLRLNRVMQRWVIRGKPAVYNFRFGRVPGIRKQEAGLALYVWTQKNATMYWTTQDVKNPFNHTHYNQTIRLPAGHTYLDISNSQLYPNLSDSTTTLFVTILSHSNQLVSLFLGQIPIKNNNKACGPLSTSSSCCANSACKWCELPVGKHTYGVCSPVNYSGLACMTSSSGCASTQTSCGKCKNGLCWWDGKGKAYRCDCKQGWGGEYCTLPVKADKCSQYKCKWSHSKHKVLCQAWKCNGKGSQCYTDQKNNPYCQCAKYYHGNHCQYKEVCNQAVTKCQHGSTCVEVRRTYICKCTKGYTGRYCQTKQSTVCLQNPCLHGGKCLPKYGKPVCRCPAGWYGPTCNLKGVPVSKCDAQHTTACIMGVKGGDPNDPNARCGFYQSYIQCALKYHCIDMVAVWCNGTVASMNCSLQECKTVAPGCNMNIYLQCYSTLQKTNQPYCAKQQQYVQCAVDAGCYGLGGVLCKTKSCGLKCPIQNSMKLPAPDSWKVDNAEPLHSSLLETEATDDEEASEELYEPEDTEQEEAAEVPEWFGFEEGDDEFAEEGFDDDMDYLSDLEGLEEDVLPDDLSTRIFSDADSSESFDTEDDEDYVIYNEDEYDDFGFQQLERFNDQDILANYDDEMDMEGDETVQQNDDDFYYNESDEDYGDQVEQVDELPEDDEGEDGEEEERELSLFESIRALEAEHEDLAIAFPPSELLEEEEL